MFYKIETERLHIRCYEPDDAALFKNSIDESIAHLKPFMPWAAFEPQTIEEKTKLLTTFKNDFIQNTDYTFGIFDKDESKLIGSCGLHTRVEEKSFEIGYWINAYALNHGFATEASTALTKAAFDYLDTDKIYIFHNVENYASKRIPEKLGFTEISENEVPALRLAALKKQGTHQYWQLTKENYAHNPIKNFKIKVFNTFE